MLAFFEPGDKLNSMTLRIRFEMEQLELESKVPNAGPFNNGD